MKVEGRFVKCFTFPIFAFCKLIFATSKFVVLFLLFFKFEQILLFFILANVFLGVGTLRGSMCLFPKKREGYRGWQVAKLR